MLIWLISMLLVINITACKNAEEKNNIDNTWKNNSVNLIDYGKNSDGGYTDFDTKISAENLSNTWYAVQISNYSHLSEYNKLDLESYLLSSIKNSNIVDLYKILNIAELTGINIKEKDNILKWLKSIQKLDGSYENKSYNGELKNEDKDIQDIVLSSYALRLLLLNRDTYNEEIQKTETYLLKAIDNLNEQFLKDDSKISDLYIVLYSLKQAEYNVKNIDNINKYIQKCKDIIQKLKSAQEITMFFLPSIFYCEKVIQMMEEDTSLIKDFVSKISNLQDINGGFKLSNDQPRTLFATYYAVNLLNDIDQTNILNLGTLKSYLKVSQTPHGGYQSGISFNSDLTSTSVALICQSYFKQNVSEESIEYIKNKLLTSLKNKDVKSWREIYYCITSLRLAKSFDTEYMKILKDYIYSDYKDMTTAKFTVDERQIGNVYFILKIFNELGLEPDKILKDNAIAWSKNYLSSISDKSQIQLIYFSSFVLNIYNEIPENKNRIIEIILNKKSKDSIGFQESNLENILSTLRSVQIMKSFDSNEIKINSYKSYLNDYKNIKGGYNLVKNDEKVTLGSTFLGVLLEKEVDSNEISMLF